ncbi:GtrA family protein [Pseudomonas fluorescens]|uniref:GtrA family protein n=1 Tax=Pseudomonas fluorescens TaxID=294 RepID=UPI00113090C5|nr:GtrA family protein [Pseudomonas fluorescens]
MNEISRFLFVGGVSALLNWSSRFLFSIWFSYEASVALAFFIGLTSGFCLMKMVVFQNSTKPTLNQAGYFLIVNIFALALTWTVSVYLAKVFFPLIGLDKGAESIAHLIGITAPIITSYFGHKYLTFR